MGPLPHEKGTTFRLWAPHADSVGIVGDFNEWKENLHELTHEGDGYWAIDVSEAKTGDHYKYVIKNGQHTLFRIDPYARQVTNSVGNSLIHDPNFDWQDSDRFHIASWNELVIYEMHIGTFHDEPGGGPGTFAGVQEKLPYLRELGVNAIQLMPPMEFAGGFSWGYNPSLPFAIESDYGIPADLKRLVKAAHEAGIAVILDVVYNHMGPSDLDLWQFDGWQENNNGGIYFYNDHRAETPWGHTRPDYGRPEVRQFLRDNALMWLQEYHIDGLRWDATAFIRDVRGNDTDPGSELPQGWSLMQWINHEMKGHSPGKISIAEDLRNNEWLVKSEGEGGAGFGAQWDSQFVHPVREAIITGKDEHRNMEAVSQALTHRYNNGAFSRVIYTESHDEVANGKARVPEEIWPGNSEHWFAKKRSSLGAVLVLTAPGIPMIFQGQEFLEDKWFSDTDPLDWQRAQRLANFVQLYRDLIHLRRNNAGHTKGLTGPHIHVYHVNQFAKVLAYHRWQDGGPDDSTIVVVNMSNQSFEDYCIGFPAPGRWHLRFDSHGAHYDEAYTGQLSADVEAIEGEYDGQPCNGRLAIAPYSGFPYLFSIR